MEKDPYAEGMVAAGTPADTVDLPRPRPKKITSEDQKKMKDLIEKTTGYNEGGMVRGDGIARVKTKGKIC